MFYSIWQLFNFFSLSNKWIPKQALSYPEENSCDENDQNFEKYFKYVVFSQCRLKSILLEVLNWGWEKK